MKQSRAQGHTRADKAVTPEAFLRFAQKYHLAATSLLPRFKQVDSPVYFLYTHALELAFKAYLRSHGLPTPQGQRGHDLRSLLEACRKQGLQVRSDESDLLNVVNGLQSENKEHGFRYYLFKPTVIPDIAAVREVVDDALSVVEEEVKNRPSKATGAVVKMTFGKPSRK